MKNINDCKQWIQSHVDVVIDLVRMYLGVGLFVKGLYFLMHKEEMQKLLEGADNVVFAQGAVAHYVIPVHLVGGLLLAIGLLTRLAALVLFLFVLIFVYGGGRFSVDHLITKKERRDLQPQSAA